MVAHCQTFLRRIISFNPTVASPLVLKPKLFLRRAKCSCGVLRNLVGVEEIKSMCSKDEQTHEFFVRQGGIQELVSVLSDPNPLSSSKSKEIALRAIDNLCFGSPGCLNALMSCKFLDHLLYLLSNGEISVQESALKVTPRLCSLPEDVKRIMGDDGFMPELVKFLDAGFENCVCEMSQKSLLCVPQCDCDEFASENLCCFKLSFLKQQGRGSL
ncbi:hypothetical protein Bca4012_038015 [Brassica carinata]